MITRILLLFLTALWLISCRGDGTYGEAGNTDFSPGAGYSTKINTQNSCDSSSGKWGGVTCKSGKDTDTGFLGYLSSGTNTDLNSEKAGIKSISCYPKNDGGILFQARVVLNGTFNSNGKNNNLNMDPSSSQLELVAYDSRVGQRTESGKEISPIGAVFKGVSGRVNGNQAINLTFSYTGRNGKKDITLNGTFNNELFTGQMRYSNAQNWDGTTPGKSGTLGDFKIRTCVVFSSN